MVEDGEEREKGTRGREASRWRRKEEGKEGARPRQQPSFLPSSPSRPLRVLLTPPIVPSTPIDLPEPVAARLSHSEDLSASLELGPSRLVSSFPPHLPFSPPTPSLPQSILASFVFGCVLTFRIPLLHNLLQNFHSISSLLGQLLPQRRQRPQHPLSESRLERGHSSIDQRQVRAEF